MSKCVSAFSVVLLSSNERFNVVYFWNTAGFTHYWVGKESSHNIPPYSPISILCFLTRPCAVYTCFMCSCKHGLTLPCCSLLLITRFGKHCLLLDYSVSRLPAYLGNTAVACCWWGVATIRWATHSHVYSMSEMLCVLVYLCFLQLLRHWLHINRKRINVRYEVTPWLIIKYSTVKLALTNMSLYSNYSRTENSLQLI